jgi:hypothetical protein
VRPVDGRVMSMNIYDMMGQIDGCQRGSNRS